MKILAPLLLLAGCGGPEPRALRAAVVDTASPFVEPGTVVGPMPSLGVDGQCFAAPFFATGPHAIHEGVFSDGLDLAAGPSFGDDGAGVSCPGSSPRCAWLDGATGTAHASTPDFPTVLSQAIGDALALELPKLDKTAVQAALDILKELGAATNAIDPHQKLVGFAAERGRWLASIRAQLFRALFRIDYADPTVMANLRERGARLYCAAREAQNAHQSGATKSMGKQVGFSVTLFGSEIDFFTVEPTLVLDGPQPYLGGTPRCPIDPAASCGPSPHDGAQAFMVPFLLGTRITPISFLPSLPELRYPLVMVTGDSEVVTRDNVTPHLFFPTFKDYHTVTHADAIMTTEGGGTAGASTPLFFIGPVEIDLNVGIGMGVGQLFSDETTHCPSAPAILPSLPGATTPPNDRLLAGAPFGWPGHREGNVSAPYDDGKWTLSSYAASTFPPHTFQVLSSAPTDPTLVGALARYDPFLLRALEDDDRDLYASSTLGLCAGISGKLGGSLGPLDVSLTAGGNLTGNVAMRHSLRDAALTTGGLGGGAVVIPPTPISAVTVIPSTRANAGFELFVHLTLEIDLGFFGTLTIFDDDLVNTGVINLASYDSGPWDESHRFRLGTGSSLGDPLLQPSVASHFPGAGPFASFPTGVDVCLADPSPNAPTPPPCGSQPPPANAGPPHTNLCVYGSGPSQAAGVPALPPGVCGVIDAYVASLPGTAQQHQCIHDELVFLCRPVSQEQPFGGQTVVARIFDLTSTSEASELGAVVGECVAANVPASSSDPHGDAEKYLKTLFHFAFCDGTATLLAPSGVVTPPASPSTPPPVTPSNCM